MPLCFGKLYRLNACRDRLQDLLFAHRRLFGEILRAVCDLAVDDLRLVVLHVLRQDRRRHIAVDAHVEHQKLIPKLLSQRPDARHPADEVDRLLDGDRLRGTADALFIDAVVRGQYDDQRLAEVLADLARHAGQADRDFLELTQAARRFDERRLPLARRCQRLFIGAADLCNILFQFAAIHACLFLLVAFYIRPAAAAAGIISLWIRYGTAPPQTARRRRCCPG